MEDGEVEIEIGGLELEIGVDGVELEVDMGQLPANCVYDQAKVRF
jgi:hypothetical protein